MDRLKKSASTIRRAFARHARSGIQSVLAPIVAKFFPRKLAADLRGMSGKDFQLPISAFRVISSKRFCQVDDIGNMCKKMNTETNTKRYFRNMIEQHKEPA